MKKALITGITGQDGAYLAEFLLAKGYGINVFTLPTRELALGFMSSLALSLCLLVLGSRLWLLPTLMLLLALLFVRHELSARLREKLLSHDKQSQLMRVRIGTTLFAVGAIGVVVLAHSGPLSNFASRAIIVGTVELLHIVSG